MKSGDETYVVKYPSENGRVFTTQRYVDGTSYDYNEAPEWLMSWFEDEQLTEEEMEAGRQIKLSEYG